MHLLERDHPTGMMRIRARVFGLMPLGDAPCLWMPGIVAARSIAFRHVKRSIRAADRLHGAATILSGDQQGSNSLQFIRLAPSVGEWAV